MIRSYAVLIQVLGAVLAVTSTASFACRLYVVDTGYVRDEDNCDVDENVITYSTVRHNHWESGGSFTITDTAQTSNGWQVGAKAGYEASVGVKAGVLAEVTASAKVSVEVGGELSGDEVHTWEVSDTVIKQNCKCPVYKVWVDKPTEVGSRKVEHWTDPCYPGPDFLRWTEWAEGTATGDHNEEAGVTSHYNFTQNANECLDCYGTGGNCPGTP